MEPIQLVDLRRQYERIREDVEPAIARVIATTAFIKGPDVESFERELAAYTGAPAVVGCANGTDALQICLMALGLEPGDEVITPDFTYFATAEVIALLRLTPVLVDVDPRTFTIDPREVERAISPKTRAILPVHLYGQCADMAPLLALAKRHGVAIVEDAAQAIGASYTFPDGTTKQAGTMGTLGATSFFPSKNLGCFGDGGAIFVNDDSLTHRVRMIANHGQSSKYVHDLVGINSRLDTLQAAVLRVKLRQLDAYATARNDLATAYDGAFSDLTDVLVPQRSATSSHVFHQYTLLCDAKRRDAIAAGLKARGVPTAVYYPAPIHAQKAFAQFGPGRDCPVSTELCTRALSLPMHTEMDAEQVEHITRSVREVAHATSL